VTQSAAPLSLWSAPLDLRPSLLKELEDCISADEFERAGRYRQPLDRDRFVASRGWLRRLLASQLRGDAHDVRFTTREGGKPMLVDSDLRFNASRSAGVALYATSWTNEVGVDIEQIRDIADVDGFAERFFSPAERSGLAALAPADRLAASFQCWAHKEAYLKGLGTGLTVPLQTLDTWSGDAAHSTVDGWSIHQVDAGFGFAAAVAGTGLSGWASVPPESLGSLKFDPATGTIERLSREALGDSLGE
jgi:4'-phosphopantetheinyl transferase